MNQNVPRLTDMSHLCTSLCTIMFKHSTHRAGNSAHGEEWKMEIKREGGLYTCLIEDQDKSPPHASFYGCTDTNTHT